MLECQIWTNQFFSDLYSFTKDLISECGIGPARALWRRGRKPIRRIHYNFLSFFYIMENAVFALVREHRSLEQGIGNLERFKRTLKEFQNELVQAQDEGHIFRIQSVTH